MFRSHQETRSLRKVRAGEQLTLFDIIVSDIHSHRNDSLRNTDRASSYSADITNRVLIVVPFLLVLTNGLNIAVFDFAPVPIDTFSVDISS